MINCCSVCPSQSLEILVRQFHATEKDVVDIIVHQLQNSTVWRYRAAAAKLLVCLGEINLSSLHLIIIQLTSRYCPLMFSSLPKLLVACFQAFTARGGGGVEVGGRVRNK